MTGIILAHGRAQETVARNMSTWSAWCDSYEFVCPCDDPIKDYDYVICSGLSQHNGLDTIERMRLAFERAAAYKSAVVLEYDTLLFGSPPKPKKNEIFGCGPFFDGSGNFKANWWSHSPWLTTKANFKKISECFNKNLEARFPDRWLAAVCDQCNLVNVSYEKWWSQNSIDTPQFEIESLEARKVGAIAIHGVKTEKVYDMLK